MKIGDGGVLTVDGVAHLLGEDLYNNLIGYLTKHLQALKEVGDVTRLGSGGG